MTFNRERGEWPLKAGDTTYKLRLTTNAMAEVEEMTNGRTWDQVIEGLMRGSVKDCRLLIWASLRQFHPEIATDDDKALTRVGDLIDEAGGLTVIVQQIREFVEGNAKPKPAAGKGQPASADPPAATVADGIGEARTPTPSLSV